MSEHSGPRLTFLTRRGCHLCVEALETVRRVAEEEDARITVVDVDTQPNLADRFGQEVPVLLVNGVRLFKYHVDADRLRRSLRARRQEPADRGHAAAEACNPQEGEDG